MEADAAQLMQKIIRINRALLDTVRLFDILLTELKEFTVNYGNLTEEARQTKMRYLRDLLNRMEITLNVADLS